MKNFEKEKGKYENLALLLKTKEGKNIKDDLITI